MTTVEEQVVMAVCGVGGAYGSALEFGLVSFHVPTKILKTHFSHNPKTLNLSISISI